MTSSAAYQLPADLPLLDQLAEAHRDLETAMAAMQAATEAPSPHNSNYSSARWRLSHASRHRRSLVARICQRLIPHVAAADAVQLKEHHARDLRLSNCSAAHVGKWSQHAIDADWAGYCKASREIRRTMREALVAEKQLLYPILRKYAYLG